MRGCFGREEGGEGKGARVTASWRQTAGGGEESLPRGRD